jgi:hypothetical protein
VGALIWLRDGAFPEKLDPPGLGSSSWTPVGQPRSVGDLKRLALTASASPARGPVNLAATASNDKRTSSSMGVGISRFTFGLRLQPLPVSGHLAFDGHTIALAHLHVNQ